MVQKRWLTFGILVLGSLFVLSAFAQPAFAAERVVEFDNPGCA